jgi:hypothetical protein
MPPHTVAIQVMIQHDVLVGHTLTQFTSRSRLTNDVALMQNVGAEGGHGDHDLICVGSRFGCQLHAVTESDSVLTTLRTAGTTTCNTTLTSGWRYRAGFGSYRPTEPMMQASAYEVEASTRGAAGSIENQRSTQAGLRWPW